VARQSQKVIGFLGMRSESDNYRPKNGPDRQRMMVTGKAQASGIYLIREVTVVVKRGFAVWS
jgi:hypothetical protein